LGEAPLLRQCTFSLWTDAQAMRAYAGQGAHRQAVEQVHAHDLFSESLFLRMHLLAQSGHWPAAWAAESSRSAPGLPGAQGATRGSGR
jgi:spheroidene monooxygenase